MIITEGVRSAGLQEGDMRNWVESITPMGRVGTVQEIASVVLFLHLMIPHILQAKPCMLQVVYIKGRCTRIPPVLLQLSFFSGFARNHRVLLCIHKHTSRDTKMTSVTMTVRLDDDAKLRLDKLAEITHRSKSFLAAEAINEYLVTQEWQLAEIKKGIFEADDNQVIDHSTIVKNWESKKRANSMDNGCESKFKSC